MRNRFKSFNLVVNGHVKYKKVRCNKLHSSSSGRELISNIQQEVIELSEYAAATEIKRMETFSTRQGRDRCFSSVHQMCSGSSRRSVKFCWTVIDQDESGRARSGPAVGLRPSADPGSADRGTDSVCCCCRAVRGHTGPTCLCCCCYH